MSSKEVTPSPLPPQMYIIFDDEKECSSIRKLLYFCTAAHSVLDPIVIFTAVNCKWFPRILTSCLLKREYNSEGERE